MMTRRRARTLTGLRSRTLLTRRTWARRERGMRQEPAPRRKHSRRMRGEKRRRMRRSRRMRRKVARMRDLMSPCHISPACTRNKARKRELRQRSKEARPPLVWTFLLPGLLHPSHPLRWRHLQKIRNPKRMSREVNRRKSSGRRSIEGSTSTRKKRRRRNLPTPTAGVLPPSSPSVCTTRQMSPTPPAAACELVVPSTCPPVAWS
mmetsp:Transcript_1474/g.3196  ORF Transcript_1474/g.3196 Transcript_1474/m.3196 type:complete len:205 (-) Transcript_1474:1598-2212(-)